MKRQTVNPSKIARVAALKQSLSQAKSVAIVDYKGLKVSQATALRRAIKAAGGEMKVEKNTLFSIAAQSHSSQFSILSSQLTGLSAFIFSNADEVAALKAVAGKLPFKLGLWGDRILSAVEVEALANTPTRETSISKLVYLFQSPASRLVRTLNEIAKSKNTPTYSPPNLGGDTEGVQEVGGDIS